MSKEKLPPRTETAEADAGALSAADRGVSRGGSIVEIAIPGCPDSIFLVPDDQADELRAKARNPGRCWSHSEVAALRSQGATTNEAVKIAEAKMLLHAGALWTRPGKAEREADQKAAEQSGLSFE